MFLNASDYIKPVTLNGKLLDEYNHRYEFNFSMGMI